MTQAGSATNEKTLYSSHPSMFRNRPVLFLICVVLSLVGVGLVILLLWYIQCQGTTLIVTNKRTTLRKGILSKQTTEVWHRDVRNVQLSQTFGQRIFGVGQLAVSSAGQAGMEIDISGIPSPTKAKNLIDEYRGS